MNPESKQTAASAVPAPWRRRHSAVLLAAGAAPALIAPPRAHANFLAAAQAAQGELSTLGKTAATASKQLKDALRRAGADVSALDLEIAN